MAGHGRLREDGLRVGNIKANRGGKHKALRATCMHSKGLLGPKGNEDEPPPAPRERRSPSNDWPRERWISS